MRIQKLLAWGVHFFTASGIIFGFLSILAIEARDFRMAMFWLIICLIIDGVDGTLARRFKVKEVLPYMSGKSMDYVIDFATYAIIPTYFFYSANLVPDDWRLPLSFLMLITAAIYYGKDGMVSDNQHFVGFPVLWNLAVFYLFFIFQFPDWANILMIITLSILHFIPIKTAYPSHSKQFKIANILVSTLAIIGMFLVVWAYPERNSFFIGIMIFVFCYFTFLAIYESLQKR